MMVSRETLNGRNDLVELQDAVEFLDHRRRPVKESERIPGEFPYYGANGQQGTINDYIFDEPLVLLAEDGGHFGIPGRPIAYKVAGRCWVNNHAHVLRPKSNVDGDFLFRQLQFYNVIPFVSGSTRGKLTKGAASRIPIALPPLAEQKRIAAILDKADALRQKRKQSLKLLDEFIRSVFLEMFGDPVVNPKGWKIVKTIDVCDCIVPGRDKPKSFTGNIPWVTTDDLVVLGKSYSSKKQLGLTQEEIAYVKSKVVPKESVLLTCVGELGIISIAGQDMVINQQLHSFQCSELVDPVFLMYSLSFQKPYMEKMASSTTVFYMNKSICNSIPTILPPIELQNKFAGIVEKADKLKHRLEDSQQELDNQFNSLVQRAFRGEL